MEVSTARFGPLCVEATHDYDLRSIFPQELPLLLSAAGLELISRFGDLSRAPFGTGSRVQVCLCRRRV